jgi:hypothetical protein
VTGLALRLGPLRIPWPGSEPKDPYWDAFVNRPVRDPRNLTQEALRSPGGAVNPTRMELHTPEITADHLKQLATFLGAELMGVVRLKEPAVEAGPDAKSYPFAIVCAVRTDYDPRVAKGVGGQVAVRNGRFVTFTLAAYIREMGYQATNQLPADQERLAAAAGLGTLDREGRLVTSKGKPRVYVADEVIHTDLPLAPNGEA